MRKEWIKSHFYRLVSRRNPTCPCWPMVGPVVTIQGSKFFNGQFLQCACVSTWHIFIEPLRASVISSGKTLFLHRILLCLTFFFLLATSISLFSILHI